MDRPIIYPGEVPASGDLLYGWQRTMVAVADLARAVFGQPDLNAWVDGLQVTPGSGLSVTVNPGQMYEMAPIDANTYGSLPANTTQILRQYSTNRYQTLQTPAPSTSGQSVYYLVQFIPQTIDAGETVLQYFDVANPNVAFGGPANSGTAQPTERLDTVTVQLVSGTPSTSPVPPALSNGAVFGWTVLVANGQTAISQSNIALASGSAPSLNLKLPYAAGVNVSNTFTQPQYINGTLTVNGQGVFSNGIQLTNYSGITFTGGNSSIYEDNSGNGPNDLVVRTGTPSQYYYTVFYSNGGLGVPGSLGVGGGLSVAGATSLSTTTVPDATAAQNPVPLGQLDSLIPQLFTSVNNVTGSRSLGATYTNNTGKPMLLMVTTSIGNGSTGGATMYINGGAVAYHAISGSAGAHASTMTAIVPNGSNYQVTNDNSASLSIWVEIY